jgi:hypothetical protein
VLVLDFSNQCRDVTPLRDRVEVLMCDQLHALVKAELLLELTHELRPDNFHGLGQMKHGEVLAIEDVVAEKAEKKLDDMGVPSDVASVQGSSEDLFLQVVAVDLDTAVG